MHAEVFRAWIAAAARVIREQRDHLTQLDAAIGDADHGINLDRGFTAVLSAIESAAPATPGAVLTVAGELDLAVVFERHANLVETPCHRFTPTAAKTSSRS